jgi:DNA mismatch repair protein MutL
MQETEQTRGKPHSSAPLGLHPRVQLLPHHVSEKIAAGEVVERPSSVIKELVENSIDAGAREILISLKEGGKSLIEVVDDGCGMTAEDITLCIQRHATSKVRKMEDLESLTTLGFRGEALPSISAVAELQIISRSKGEETAHELRCSHQEETPQAKPITFGHFRGSSHGTKITVESLFAQIPARLKFLKAPSAEVSQVRDWVERLSISHPEISFQLVNNDRSIIHLRAQEEKERIQSILSDSQDYPLVSAESNNGMRIRAHWLQGFSAPHTRKLIQVVNGRALRDRLLQQAILAPFRQALLPGQFPALVLFVDIPPSEIDVNVHPTKTEIRFLNPRELFKKVKSLIESMISDHGSFAYAGGKSASFDHSRFGGFGAREPGHETQFSSSQSDSQGFFQSAEPGPSHSPQREPRSGFKSEAFSLTYPNPSEPPPIPGSIYGTGDKSFHHPLKGARFSGTLFRTYLFFETSSDEITVVDQHAAHERVRYEKLKKQVFDPTQTPAQQQLLLPEVVNISEDQLLEIQNRIFWLEKMGFEVEVFSEESLLFRAIPASWSTGDLKTRLGNLISRLVEIDESENNELIFDETLFEKLASEACHSSIRAGDPLSEPEARALVDDLFLCEHPWNCPHGRPSIVKVPKARLEDWFKRRVPSGEDLSS